MKRSARFHPEKKNKKKIKRKTRGNFLPHRRTIKMNLKKQKKNTNRFEFLLVLRTIIHFDGLKAKELVSSTPSMKFRNSGQMKALPAYAASTWIQICSRSPKLEEKFFVELDFSVAQQNLTNGAEFNQIVKSASAGRSQSRAKLKEKQKENRFFL